MILIVLAAGAAFLLPTGIKLELYDVQDLSCDLAFFPSVDINIASPGIQLDPICDGEELALRLQGVVPGPWTERSGRSVQFQNGLLIVRATRTQHAGVDAYLAFRRAQVRLEEAVLRAKTTICATVFGMITK